MGINENIPRMLVVHQREVAAQVPDLHPGFMVREFGWRCAIRVMGLILGLTLVPRRLVWTVLKWTGMF